MSEKIKPKEVYVKKRSELDEAIANLQKKKGELCDQEYYAYAQNKFDDALKARERKLIIQGQIDFAMWAITKDEK